MAKAPQSRPSNNEAFPDLSILEQEEDDLLLALHLQEEEEDDHLMALHLEVEDRSLALLLHRQEMQSRRDNTVAQRLSRQLRAKSAAAVASPNLSADGPKQLRTASEPRGTGGNSAAGAVECQSCFDRFPKHAVSCADARIDGDVASKASKAAAGCGHYFCSGCLSEYVVGAVRDRKYPVTCPMAGGAGGGGCKMQLSRDCVMNALRQNPDIKEGYEGLEAEAAVGPVTKIYCPFKGCSSPLFLASPDDVPTDEPVTCPECNRGFCHRCGITGWHTGYTCAQFQALPAHLRSVEDAAMLQFASRQQWKQCPKCKQMVEKSEGCNHMRCRCGSHFCYACGALYEDRDGRPTSTCSCPLFAVPPTPQGNP